MSKWYRYAKAEASRIVHGDVETATYEARLQACRNCEQLDAGEPIGWCRACGCGRRARAELSIKGRMPSATCPLGRW